MNPRIDEYLEEGCGKCDLYRTENCKVNFWRPELIEIRRIFLECGMEEEHKWSMPVYCWNGKNVAMMAAFKDNATLSFFKGVLLKDPYKILNSPGKNSEQFRLFRFTDVSQILEIEDKIKEYIFEAVEIEKAGIKLPVRNYTELELVDEFQEALDADDTLKQAFDSLTNGRKKSWLIHFSGAKQSKTRYNRVEKAIPKILDGKGHNEM